MAGGVDPAPASSSCTSTSSASTSSADNASSPAQPPPAPPPPPLSAAAPPTHAASPHISTPLPPAPLPPPTSSSPASVPFHHAPASHQQLHHLHQQHSHPNLPQRLFSGHPPAVTPSMAADRHVRDDCWSEEATKALIQAWGERYMELNRGNLKQKHWKDVALCVNRRGGGGGGGKAPKTDVQCKNRLDTLKKKYKIEKSKLVMGGAPSKWAFFNSLDALIGPSKKPTKLSAPPKHPPICLDERSHDSKPSPSLPFLSQNPNPNPNPNLYLNPFPSPNLNRVPHSNPDANPYPDPNSTVNNPNPDQNPSSHPKTAPFPDPNPSPAADTASKSRSSSSLHGRRKPSRGKRRAAACCDSDSGSFGDLASAIMRLAEAYERVEMVKQQQMLELEKQRMELAKDLEIRRLQLFTQTQVELAKLKHGKGKQNSTGSYTP